MKDLFQTNVSNYNLRTSNDLSVHRVNQTTFEWESFQYEAVVTKNHLTSNIKNADNTETFYKSYLKPGVVHSVNVQIIQRDDRSLFKNTLTFKLHFARDFTLFSFYYDPGLPEGSVRDRHGLHASCRGQQSGRPRMGLIFISFV